MASSAEKAEVMDWQLDADGHPDTNRPISVLGLPLHGFHLSEIKGAQNAPQKVKSNKARTQATRSRELGLIACGELAGVVAKTLMGCKSIHRRNIVMRAFHVNSCGDYL